MAIDVNSSDCWYENFQKPYPVFLDGAKWRAGTPDYCRHRQDLQKSANAGDDYYPAGCCVVGYAAATPSYPSLCPPN